MKFICLVAVGVLPTLRTAAQRAPNGPVPYKFPERRGALAPPPPRSLSLQATPSQPAPLTVFPRTGHALPTYFPHDDYERAKRELTEKEMKTEKTPPPCQPTGKRYSEYGWTPMRHVSLGQLCTGSQWQG
uniref:Uncharacterized protein n=1 Tax=Toxoplasma gondii (strain ATCC 50861 / VEG) TaxID=432359 RepID=A0A0F7V8A3_TOXGV|nr:TPA: hypothetical protein BN1205_095270 [Toxoplasma gondii VEG]